MATDWLGLASYLIKDVQAGGMVPDGALDERIRMVVEYQDEIENISNEISKLLEARSDNIDLYDIRATAILNHFSRIGSLCEGERARRIRQAATATHASYLSFRVMETWSETFKLGMMNWLLMVNTAVFPNDKDRLWKTVLSDFSGYQKA